MSVRMVLGIHLICHALVRDAECPLGLVVVAGHAVGGTEVTDMDDVSVALIVVGLIGPPVGLSFEHFYIRKGAYFTLLLSGLVDSSVQDLSSGLTVLPHVR